MSILLALASAVTYGSADFLGGMASRRAPALVVVAVSQVFGLALLLAALPLLPAAHPSAADFAWGALAGVAGGAGILFLYRGLAAGPMSIVAPVTAACAATIPVPAGLALGERPGRAALAGVAVAIVAIALVSRQRSRAAGGRQPEGRCARAALTTAVTAGVAFGAFFILLDRASTQAGLWPLVGSRAGSFLLYGSVALATNTALRLPRAALRTTLSAGVLDMAANVFYLVALRHGLLSIVAVLTSLYPASTVVLARVVLKERMSPLQLGGIACAAVAVVLIAGG